LGKKTKVGGCRAARARGRQNKGLRGKGESGGHWHRSCREARPVVAMSWLEGGDPLGEVGLGLTSTQFPVKQDQKKREGGNIERREEHRGEDFRSIHQEKIRGMALKNAVGKVTKRCTETCPKTMFLFVEPNYKGIWGYGKRKSMGKKKGTDRKSNSGSGGSQAISGRGKSVEEKERQKPINTISPQGLKRKTEGKRREKRTHRQKPGHQIQRGLAISNTEKKTHGKGGQGGGAGREGRKVFPHRKCVLASHGVVKGVREISLTRVGTRGGTKTESAWAPFTFCRFQNKTASHRGMLVIGVQKDGWGERGGVKQREFLGCHCSLWGK